jgi:putative spermidine/putrescine transport system ATP-binding protein
LQQQAYGPVHVLLRPEVIGVQPAPDGPACIERVTFFGTHQQVSIRLSNDTRVQARVPPAQSLTSGMMVRLVLPQTVLIFPE